VKESLDLAEGCLDSPVSELLRGKFPSGQGS